MTGRFYNGAEGRNAMPYLEITRGQAVVQSPLGDEAMSIGRQPGNSIVINDPDISRQHCVIDRVNGRYRVFDVGSRNGLVVNGRRVQQAELASGDVIALGKTVARFIDAPLRARRRWAVVRHWLVWLPAMTVFAATSFVAAWATGMLGERFPLWEIREYLKLVDPSSAAASSRPAPAPSGNQTPSAAPVVRDAKPEQVQDDVLRFESETDRLRYERLPSTFTLADADRLVGRLVTGRFIGKPVRDATGRLTWELPPDGMVTALLDAVSPAAMRVAHTLEREPLLLEADLSGVLRRDPATGRLVLRVGVVELQRAWGNSDTLLQPATQDLLHRRAIIHGEYAASDAVPGS